MEFNGVLGHEHTQCPACKDFGQWTEKDGDFLICACGNEVALK